MRKQQNGLYNEKQNTYVRSSSNHELVNSPRKETAREAYEYEYRLWNIVWICIRSAIALTSGTPTSDSEAVDAENENELEGAPGERRPEAASLLLLLFVVEHLLAVGKQVLLLHAGPLGHLDADDLALEAADERDHVRGGGAARRVRARGGRDLEELGRAALAHAQQPRAGVRLELEVAEVRHHDRVVHHRVVPGAQSELQPSRRLPGAQLRAVALEQLVLELESGVDPGTGHLRSFIEHRGADRLILIIL